MNDQLAIHNGKFGSGNFEGFQDIRSIEKQSGGMVIIMTAA